MDVYIKKSLVALSFLFFSVVSISQCYAVSVGDSYGGGTVFCVSQTADTSQCVTTGSGDYGLIMANEDQASYLVNPQGGITWSSVYSNTGAQSLDNGATNTATIIAALPSDNSNNNAAWLCHDYTDQKEGHTDWYLPSKNELNKIYAYAKANYLIGKNCFGSKLGGVQCLVGGLDDDGYVPYWSSSEYPNYNNYYADDQHFDSGVQNNGDKVNGYLGVRAIRAFKPQLVSVGDSYGGGTVFCVSQTADISQCATTGSGYAGLIMANDDQANDLIDPKPKGGITWSSTYSYIGATSLDSGAANTATIIAALPNDNPSNNAAWLCHDYRDQKEGHTDWYFPSTNELDKMYIYANASNLIGKDCSGSKQGGVQCLVGSSFAGDDYKMYWSSTECGDSGDFAFCESFTYGGGASGFASMKDSSYIGVRAVRAFNNLAIQQPSS